ncbi:hypothetical protein [Natronorubrum halophilum]|uniref:hypothetical protein n=1 Tax=Natronorubrum halophilum TaxID=1702106 RepID=UPI0010C1B532|nr:hypothetical protein [Natronorubrum halophilum]
MTTNTTDAENRAAEDATERESNEKTTGAGMTRRRTLQLGTLVGAGSVLGVAGIGADAAAASCDRPDSVVHLDYDDYDSWEEIYRVSNGDRDNMTIVSDPTASGESALQLRVNENQHWGVSTHYDFEGGLFELTGRVSFALNTNWTMGGRNAPSNCRLWNCAIALGEGSAGGGDPDGTNGWSNRMYVTDRGADPNGPFHLLSNTYHMGNGDGTGDHTYLIDGEEYAQGSPEIEPGVWYDFEYYVCVNTVTDGEANADGIVRYWLDDELIFERENFKFTEDYDDNIIDTNGPVGHYGGRYTAPQNLYAYYDDHSMALNGEFEFDSC